MADIVDLLRRASHAASLFQGGAPDLLLDEAADEIERLREVAEAADQYHDVVCDPDHCRLCKALQAWREAR